ncbi:MAG: sulfotransferase domain-containing protein [Candidatus Nanopelagicales bacterium]
MLLLVCGMHRSGSTLVWQIARQLVDGKPGLRNPRGIATAEYPQAAADASDLLMAKVHFRPALNREHFPDEGAKYLYTYRDPRDVVASLYRKGRAKPGDPERGARNSRLIVRRELRGDEFWTARKHVWIGKYEDFRDDVPGLVRALADFLDVEVDDATVTQIVADNDLATQEKRAVAAKAHGVDDDLRVTSNHITDGREGAWRDTLTDEELVAIEAEGARWLVEHGYAVETAVGKRKTLDLREPVEYQPKHAGAQDRASRISGDAGDMPAALLPLAAAGVLSLAAVVSARRNPGSSSLLWAAATACGVAGAYCLGRDDQRPADLVAAVRRRIGR